MSRDADKLRTVRNTSSGAPHGRAEALDGNRRWRALAPFAAVGALALIVRLAYIRATSEVPWLQHLVGDAASYFAWAQGIAAGDWWGSEGFYQAPLYPYVLALLFSVLPESVWTVRIAQAVIGSAGIVLLATAAGTLFGRRAGVVTGVMAAVYPPAVFFDGLIQKTALASFLVCALLFAVVRFQQQSRAWIALTLGVLLGFLIITRENAAIWVPVLALWLWLATSAGPRRQATHLVFFSAGLALILAPVAARNALISGEWSISTFQAGPNFYIGNHRGATGRYVPLVRGHETPEFERADATQLAEDALGHHLTQREVSTYWMRRAMDDIQAAPGAWLRLCGRKLLMIWNRYEVSDVESPSVYAEFAPALRAVARVWHFGVLCPLAILGIGLTMTRWRKLWVWYALAVTMTLAVAAFFILARYRYPLVPLLIPFAAVGCVRLWEMVRGGQLIHTLVPLGMAVLAAVLVNLPVHEEEQLDALAHMNLGVALAKDNRLEAATRRFQRAVELHPGSAEAQANLAQALALQGRYDEAIPYYLVAAEAEPRLPGIEYNLAVALEGSGRPADALERYRRALAEDPTDADARRAIERLSTSMESGVLDAP